MNKPENGILIVPRVDRLENGSFVTLVRRLHFANGMLVGKDLLSSNGEWVSIPEGGEYPRECFIKSSHLDRRSLNNLEFNWPPLKRPYRKIDLQLGS